MDQPISWIRASLREEGFDARLERVSTSAIASRSTADPDGTPFMSGDRREAGLDASVHPGSAIDVDGLAGDV